MEHFKKRTIALVLASVVTVVGAFGAENFKNSLMSLKFDSGAGAVSMTLLTRTNYEKTIAPIKKDAVTYVIMLPEINSKMSKQPELSEGIESVDVRTMPYTSNSKGYTKITVRTYPNTMLKAQKALYIPEKTPSSENRPQSTPQSSSQLEEEEQVSVLQRPSTRQQEDFYRERTAGTIHSRSGVDQTNPVDIRESVRQFEPAKPQQTQAEPQTPVTAPQEESAQPVAIPDSTVPDYPQNKNNTEILLLVMGTILIIITCIFLFVRTKNKMAEILGEQGDFDLGDNNSNKTKAKEEKQKEKEKKKKKIKTTIKKLDKIYTQPVKMPLEHITAPQSEQLKTNDIADETENVVVDLDELFQEKIKRDSGENSNAAEAEEDENLALEEFLSSFSFTEEEPVQEPLYDEELFNKVINDENLKFTKSDIEKINALLNTEISDDTLKNINQFIVTKPIEKKASRTEILENFVTAYTINQNISFTKDDIDALNKLISVEIDKDFITDLRTNPHRLKEIQEEIQKQKAKPHKTSDLLTLNVKDMLPDLSEALKKQGGRRIESEIKPQVVYYSEGYDVSTISLKDQLPDLSKEINNVDAYKSRPSDDIMLAESGYDVAKMSVANELPDLEDMLKHPEKYDTPQTVSDKVDEEALLRGITNVTFKPFYDDSNDVSEQEQQAPSVSDIQKEFSRFDEGFEIISDEEIPQEQENEINDFESLYDNTYVDFDKGFAKEDSDIQEINTPKNNDIQNTTAKPERDEDTDKLLKFIEEKQQKRSVQENNQETQIDETTLTNQNEETTEEIPAAPEPVCIVDGEEYKILKTINFSANTGCYLAQNDKPGYYVIGFTSDSVFIIKYYENLTTENMQARLSEKLDNGILRYIVKAGTHKFILNVGLNTLEYVIDLC